MGDRIIQDIAALATAIVGLTIIAVLVSKSASTSSVIGAATSGFADDLKAAVSPLGGAA